ncbi:hypothetical protein [Pseudomonas syringae]|uniref:hypothetical protein n=1 Tax=Pseudomonas syringae TaxID=317 RepID=UPI00200B65FC|nr:hypothetical protein [Pseudomonas syringae]MCK9737279.1 hypothetical protein [Pseudomonas syringae pv. syringae]
MGVSNAIVSKEKLNQAGVSKLMTASQLIGALTAAAMDGDASAAAVVTANSTQYAVQLPCP